MSEGVREGGSEGVCTECVQSVYRVCTECVQSVYRVYRACTERVYVSGCM